MVTVKVSYMVKPVGETPTGIMYISEFDLITPLTHAPTIYFYRPPADHLHVNAIEILKDSLSKALAIFYPLAGRLQWIARGRLELNCNSAGALLLEVESEAKIDDYGDFCPTPMIKALIPSVDYNKPIHEMPLLLAQLTKFSCGGISLGLGLSHTLIDGQSALHFISEWARIARGEKPVNLPFLDRTILQLEEPLPPPSFDPSKSRFSPAPLLIGHSDNLEERMKETTVAMLKLSKEQIQKLKNKANEGRTRDNGSRRAFTRYEAVAGHMWRCASKARGHKNEQVTRLKIAVDFRSRMEPPLPKWYFGNTILSMVATTTSGELLSKPLAYASCKIREAIEMVTDEYVRSALVFLRHEPDLSKFRYWHIVGSTQGAFNGNPNMEITPWTSLPLHGANFGWGEEIHTGPGVVGFDGKSIILPGHDGDGSFIIALRLQVAHMDAFNKFFYENI